MARLTGYKAGRDNAYAGHPDGGTDTSSGVHLNEKYATCAIPMGKGRTNLKVGDIILVENTVGGVTKKSAVWVTDVGGLPHGDVDLASGAAADNLGLTFHGGKDYVNRVSGVGDVKVEVLGHVNPRGMKNPNGINEAILEVNKSVNGKTAEQIKSDLQTQIKDPKNFARAEPNKGASFTAGSGGYRERRPGEPWRDEEEYAGYLGNLLNEDAGLALFLIIIGAALGLIDEEQVSQLMDSFGGLPENVRQQAQQNLPEGMSASTFRGGSDVGAVSGFNTPTSDITKFNSELLDPTKFAKSAVYPVGNPERVVTSDFGPRNLGYGSKNHPACDFRGRAGEDVSAIFDGKVVKIGQMTVTVQNDNGTTTTYMHVDSTVKLGQEVKAGEGVAKILPKCSRSPYDPHLDLRTYDTKSGIYIHPSKYMDFEGIGVEYKAGAKSNSGAALYDSKRGVFFDEKYVNDNVKGHSASVAPASEDAKKTSSVDTSANEAAKYAALVEEARERTKASSGKTEVAPRDLADVRGKVPEKAENAAPAANAAETAEISAQALAKVSNKLEVASLALS